MNRLWLLTLLAAMAFPALGMAQVVEEDTVVGCDAYIWQLSAQCPCDVEDGWIITSVVSFGDTVTLEIEIPQLLGGFLGMLTSKSEKTGHLWADQVAQFGKAWKKLLTLLYEEKRWLSLVLVPHGTTNSSDVLVSPDEIGTVLANN